MRIAPLATLVATFLGCAATTPPPLAPPPPPPQCAGEWRALPTGDTAPIDALDKNMIVAGMKSVAPCVQACVPPPPRHWYSSPQTFVFNVAVTIAGSGQPSAHVVSRDIPPALGGCFEAAVNKASFPPFTGPPMSIVYPYVLH